MKIEHAFILYIDTPDAVKYMEECKASCIEHNIPFTTFLNFKYPVHIPEVNRMTGFRIDERLEHAQFDYRETFIKEQLCLIGHLGIWRHAIQNMKLNAFAVMEHDAIVKRNFMDIDVVDMKITFLGYRVDHRDDYECPDDPFVKYDVPKFEGTHAYAITAQTANAALTMFESLPHFPVGVSIDHYMGVYQKFGLPMDVVDPAPVIVPMEKKVSHTQPEGIAGRYNMMPHQGFMKGLKHKNKYTYDPSENYLRF